MRNKKTKIILIKLTMYFYPTKKRSKERYFKGNFSSKYKNCFFDKIYAMLHLEANKILHTFFKLFNNTNNNRCKILKYKTKTK